MKNNFYLFLDIDGVMMDWDFIIGEINAGRMKKGGLIQTFKPESIDALNVLTAKMSENYNVKLVLSSTWRSNMEETRHILKNQGVDLADKAEATPYVEDPKYRGREILDYLEKHNFNENNDDFVIIDDETFDYEKYFSNDKIIKTEIFHNALSMDMVKTYFKNNNVSYDAEVTIEK